MTQEKDPGPQAVDEGHPSSHPYMNLCYRCVHRRSAPGSAHSQCDHPEARVHGPETLVTLILGRSECKALAVEGDPHGIRNGWFCWPWNFDPVWLRHCQGFGAVAVPAEEGCST